jgi:signal transduction histidine kinase
MLLDVDIYSQKNRLKLLVMILLLLVAAWSIYYTDKIVTRLEEREEQQINLYAEALKYSLTRENNIDVNSFLELVKSTNKSNLIPAIHVTAAGELIGQNIEGIDEIKSDKLQTFLQEKLAVIKRDDHEPFSFDNGLGGKDTIYYGNSVLLNQLRYYPLVQLLAVLMFGAMTYFAFSYSRRSEQNRVWVGLAKETAHQLGTPLSSLTAWMEFFKADPERYDPQIVKEIEKDISRLDVITNRFSNIGSIPVLKAADIYGTVTNFLDYLQKRISSKVTLTIINELPDNEQVAVNNYLFEWVIENICKNAVDAMEGIGSLNVKLGSADAKNIYIDISDTGKGIDKANLAKVFNPGFSTKKRGWGLGLTLAKRIIENYHNGKLFIKKSEVKKGTTFRIVLPKNVQ